MVSAIRRMVFSSLLLVAACSGTMQGVIRGQGTPVTISYEQGVDHDIYSTMIDGERFVGKAVPASSQSAWGWNYSTNSSLLLTSMSGEFVATLIGDNGSTMRCRMNYADSTGFTSMGGVGECRHSNGKIIDIVW